MATQKTLDRYNAVSKYVNDQTEEQWQKLEAYIISQLDFDTRLEISKDQELY